MVEAGGVGKCSGIGNAQIIEKASCSKRPKRRNWAELKRIWNVEISPSCDFLLVKMRVGLVYRCLAAGWRAVAK
jgi:hypothetical protein